MSIPIVHAMFCLHSLKHRNTVHSSFLNNWAFVGEETKYELGVVVKRQKLMNSYFRERSKYPVQLVFIRFTFQLCLSLRPK